MRCWGLGVGGWVGGEIGLGLYGRVGGWVGGWEGGKRAYRVTSCGLWGA